MLVFGRQIFSRLPPKNETSSKADIVVRQFLDEDRVGVRDSCPKISGCLDGMPRSLETAKRLDDGRIWGRYIDHINGVGADPQDVLVDIKQ